MKLQNIFEVFAGISSSFCTSIAHHRISYGFTKLLDVFVVVGSIVSTFQYKNKIKT